MAATIFSDLDNNKYGDIIVRARRGRDGGPGSDGQLHDVVIRPVAGGILAFDSNLNPYCTTTLPITTGTFGDGTAAAPSITFTAEQGTGWFRRSTGAVTLASNGVAGIEFTNAGSNARMRFVATGTAFIDLLGSGGISLNAGGTDQSITLTPSGAGIINTSTAAAEVLRINSTAANGGYIDIQTSGTVIGYIGAAQAITGGGGAATMAVRAEGALIFASGGSTEAARFVSTRFLIGTTTDSGALLQIGTNTTTSAGGMIFGTDAKLYRSGTGALSFTNATLANPIVFGADASSTTYGVISFNGSLADTGFQGFAGGGSTSLFIQSTSIVMKTGIAISALTLDASQNATFAGKIGAGTTASTTTNLIVGASSTAASSFRIPSGTAPTSPVDGDMWYDGTNVKFRVGATTKSFTLT